MKRPICKEPEETVRQRIDKDVHPPGNRLITEMAPFSVGGKKFFTLIELLITIAIIAILASLLLPALSKARDRAKSATDINNIKNLGSAVLFYANDYQDHLMTMNPYWVPGSGQRSDINGGYFYLSRNGLVKNFWYWNFDPYIDNQFSFCPFRCWTEATPESVYPYYTFYGSSLDGRKITDRNVTRNAEPILFCMARPTWGSGSWTNRYACHFTNGVRSEGQWQWLTAGNVRWMKSNQTDFIGDR